MGLAISEIYESIMIIVGAWQQAGRLGTRTAAENSPDSPAGSRGCTGERRL